MRTLFPSHPAGSTGAAPGEVDPNRKSFGEAPWLADGDISIFERGELMKVRFSKRSGPRQRPTWDLAKIPLRAAGWFCDEDRIGLPP